MMKYLLIASAVINVLAIAKQASLYESVDHNEEVTRKINLEAHSVVEVTTDVKFRSISKQTNYYFVVPRELDYN